MKKSVSAIIAMSFMSATFSQTTYYVATSGNDMSGDGSLVNPFATLTQAVTSANPGDTIFLRGGTYTSDEIRIDKSDLTIKSYPGEWAVLQAPVDNTDIASCIWYNEPLTTGGLLENLEISGGYFYGVKFETNWDWDPGVPFANRRGVQSITLRNCHIHHTGRDGVKLTPACNNITIENCEIDHTGQGPGALIDLNAEGIDNVNAGNLTVRNCHIHDIATTGLYVKGGGRNCLIENNLIENTGEGGIYLGFYTDEEWFDSDSNPDYYENIDGVARNNRIVNTQHAGIGCFGALNPQVYNNTIVNAANADVYAAAIFASGEIWLPDNTIAYPTNSGVYFVNNIFVQQSSAIMPMVRIRENALFNTLEWDYNVYYKNASSAVFTNDNAGGNDWNFNQWQNATSFDNNSLEIDPQLAAGQYLQASSPCINAGTTIAGFTTDFEGQLRDATPDIGADEYGSVVGLNPLQIPNYTLLVFSDGTHHFLQIASTTNAVLPIRCYSVTGQLQFESTVEIQQGIPQLQLPDLNQGIYLLHSGEENRQVVTFSAFH